MKIEEIPVLNKDGSVKMTVVINEEQRKALLQFALNFLMAAGLSATYGIMTGNDEAPPQEYDA
jgi:hypothetical protein